MKRLVLSTIVMIALLALESCSSVDALFGQEEPTLFDTWQIESSDPDLPSYAYLRFTSTRYQILDANMLVFEEGSIYSFSDSSFHCEIIKADQDPSIIGGQNYAEYSVVTDSLRISWYDDATKETKYIRAPLKTSVFSSP